MEDLESATTNVGQPYTLWQEFKDLTTNEKRGLYSLASFLPEIPLLFYGPLFEIGCGLMVVSGISTWKYVKGHLKNCNNNNNNSSEKENLSLESL